MLLIYLLKFPILPAILILKNNTPIPPQRGILPLNPPKGRLPLNSPFEGG